jgi:hypothetical protein
MSLESDLAPRIELIRRLVRERYSEYLDAHIFGEWSRVRLNEDGAVVDALPPTANRPAIYEPELQGNLEHWQADWQNTSDAVSDLASLVHKYYEIDQDNGDGSGVMEELWRKFGVEGRPAQQLTDRETGHVPPEGGGSVYAELAYARYYVDEHIYNQLLDIRDEVRVDPDVPAHLSRSVNVVSEHWDGMSASAFFYHLSVPFDEAAGRQLVYVHELAAVIDCFRRIRDHTTTSLRRVIDNTIRSLGGAGEMDPMIPEESIDIEVGDAVNAAGLILASLGLITASGGTSIVIGVLSVSQALVSIGLAEAAKSEGPDHIDLHVAEIVGPGSPYPVIMSCQEAIGRIEEWQARKDECIGRGLEADTSDTTAFDSPRLALREPGGFSEDYDFDLNDTTKQEGVTAPINALDRAGRTHLRETTFGHYSNAMNTMLTGFIVPTWVFHFLPRSWDAYHTAHGGLVGALRTTSTNLQLWGDELVEVARGYAEADADNAGTVDRAYN